MNYKAVYKTAPATPGLLKILLELVSVEFLPSLAISKKMFTLKWKVKEETLKEQLREEEKHYETFMIIKIASYGIKICLKWGYVYFEY